VIEFLNVSKSYGETKALRNLNLKILDGEIFGLIGHNGAGKSTTIKSLVSIIEPSSGEILVDGRILNKNRLEIKREIGYVSDSPDLFLKTPVISYWDFIADVYGVKEEVKKMRIHDLCQLLALDENSGQTIEELSHGMRQKVFIIGALLSNPKTWVLDEPMTGLDPQAAFGLKELMKNHVKEGNTVLFSTHVLEVAESLCDRIGILSKGELLFVGSMKELRESYPGESLEDIYLAMVGEKGKEEE